MMPRRLLLTACLLIGNAAATTAPWWPEQKAPKAYVDAKWPRDVAGQVLVQSLSGLAARAVNDGRLDELVWGEALGQPYPEWKKRTLLHLRLQHRGRFTANELLARYVKAGIVRGYVLYEPDRSEGEPYQPRANMNLSVHGATTAAGVLDAVVVDATLEPLCREHGLSCLYDARGVTLPEVFARFKDHLSRDLLCILDPKVPHVRDMAIAHRAFVVCGTGDFTQRVLEWLKPLTPVAGWNIGDEFANTAQLSRWAHFNTASNWTLNMPFLSAVARSHTPARLRPFDPRSIDWDDRRSCVAFVMSDGDNVGWLTRDFWDERYFGHPRRGDFPFGWSACLGDLAAVAPVVLDRLAETLDGNVSMVQAGGGYFYPDLFAAGRDDRDALLRAHARQIGKRMQRSGATALTFIAHRSDSDAAKEAYRIFAEEIGNLAGMLVLDYTPYNRMQGEVFWAKNRAGVPIPAVTARYALWANLKRPRTAGPIELAQLINLECGKGQSLAWTSVHAWSRHINPESGAEEQGLGPVGWCVDRIDAKTVRVVRPEELLWRLRMAHDPGATATATAGTKRSLPR